MFNNEPVKVYRAYAYITEISEDESPENKKLIDCKNLFNGRNITTDFEDMWCTSFESGSEFCHIVIEFREPKEITGKILFVFILL